MDRLKRDIDKYQQELEDSERRYRAQNEDLRIESNKLNEVNKGLIEELTTLKKELEFARGKNGIYDSTKDNTRESLKRGGNFDRSVYSNLKALFLT